MFTMTRFYKTIAVGETVCLAWFAHQHDYVWMAITASFAMMALFLIEGKD